MEIGGTSDLPPWPLFIGFYTPEYKEEAEGLIATLRQFNLPFQIQAQISMGSWWLNTQLKAVVIQEFMEEHPNQPIVYIDCDARVRQTPTLLRHLPDRCDFAAHYRDDSRSHLFHDGRELLSGTLFFSGSPTCKRFVDLWVHENEVRARESRQTPGYDPTKLMDQRTLQAVVERLTETDRQYLRMEELPATYVQIFDTMRDAGQPVIEHMQASRRLRRTISPD